MKLKFKATKTSAEKLPLLRGAIPIVASILLLWFLRDTASYVDFAAMISAAALFSPTQWAAAGALTVISFAAVAQYDRLVAAWMGLALPRGTVIHAGWRATAISQVLGYGLVTGALTRWRALGRPGGLSLWTSTQLTIGVISSFFAGWAVVTSLAVLSVAGHFPAWTTAISLAVIVATFAVLVLSVAPPKRWAAYLPGPVFLLPIIGFAAIDTIAAAGVIFVFLPASELSFMMIYAAFLVALCAGMVSGLPGGLGAFELTFISLLAPTDPAAMLSAILAFRVIYYAAPAVLAGVSLIWVRETATDDAFDHSTLSEDHHVTASLATHAPPEYDLTCQSPLRTLIRHDQTGGVLWHRARNCDITLDDPFGPAAQSEILIRLARHAQSAGRGLALYKCSASTAKITQQLGMRAFKIGSEAIINTHNFNTNGSAFRQLRRKLRNAEKAGITVTENRPRYMELAAIDAEWQRKSGAARGFSMGYLSPALMARQRMFIALDQDQPIAFITFLIGANKWTLDIVRTKARCPDGVVHSLVMAAVDAAHEDGIATLSLAAAPFKLDAPARSLAEHVVQYLFNRSPECRGLAQFKSSFDPKWEPKYLALSSITTLPFAVLDLWQLIHAGKTTNDQFHNDPHNDYGDYEIESYGEPCHALLRMTAKDASR